ncbi:sulfatase-like hydrolase/transferase [Campylobacter geochelonis]|nr:sulfatase-like hydrolase/transferase [Campylobacter geochelonis]CZE48789.1 putative sulfatase family protein [Campylobacter geochelonis]
MEKKIIKNDNTVIKEKKPYIKTSILIVFLAGFLLGLTYFAHRHFGNFTAAQMVFHFVSDLGNALDEYIVSFREKVLLPAFIVSLLWYLMAKFNGFFGRHSLKFALVFLCCSLLYSNHKMSFYDIFTYNFIYSDFYEKEFKTPNLKDLNQTNPKNLIIIYAESLESKYDLRHEDDKNIIPNLKKVAKQGLSFTSHDGFGGHTQVKNTGWTAAGLLSYNCAFPLSSVDKENRYEKAICLGDVLDYFGYDQEYLLGSDASFAGAGEFFKTHKVKITDLKTLGLKNDIGWGILDDKLYKIAKDKLRQKATLDKPFALYISTINMHFPGNSSPNCKKYDNRYTQSVRCTDDELSEFLNWILAQNFAKNTAVVVLGDHISMVQRYFKSDAKREIFNLFLNSDFQNINTNRKASHFDMLPTILQSVNISIDEFGLGRNLTKNNPTLLEKYGLEELNKEIGKRNKFYDEKLLQQLF